MAALPYDFGELVFQRGMAVAIVAVVVYGAAWITVRLIGKEGIITKSYAKNTELLEKMEITSAQQQGLCTLHAGSAQETTKTLRRLGATLADIENHTRVFSETWGHENCSEYKILPALEVALKSIDTIQVLAKQEGLDWDEHLAKLRGEIEAIRSDVTKGG